jgi:hypothetical protein
MIKALIAIAAKAAVGLPFAQLTLGQSVWSATPYITPVEIVPRESAAACLEETGSKWPFQWEERR